MSQLDLFSHNPKAQLFVFPVDRRVSLAHAVAARLADLDFDAGKKHWQTVCRDVRNGLRRDGLPTAAIRSAIDLLADAVHEALRTINLQKQYRSPAVILSLTGQRIHPSPHGNGAGEAGALGQGTKFLAGYGAEPRESSEYDAARACDGDAA